MYNRFAGIVIFLFGLLLIAALLISSGKEHCPECVPFTIIPGCICLFGLWLIFGKK